MVKQLQLCRGLSCSREKAEEIVKFLEKEHGDKAYGDIYSVLGGREVHVLVEDRPDQSETRERPHYE